MTQRDPRSRADARYASSQISIDRSAVQRDAAGAPSSSRLPGFYELPVTARQSIVSDAGQLAPKDREDLQELGALNPELLDVFIENAVGAFALPLGVATNFKINGLDVLVPMAVEESSVLAAASHGAKLARQGGGFLTSSTDPVMTGQVQVFTDDSAGFAAYLEENSQKLIDYANDGQQRLLARGGGARAITSRRIPEIAATVLYIDIDTRDAMGANIVNTMCEKVATQIMTQFDCEIGLRILTNLTDKRMVKASCVVPWSAFHHDEKTGKEIVAKIERAYRFAQYDVYRATTHNKGVMNGIDAVVIATGNDWRAVEAGAHAYCCRSGQYQPMSAWEQNAAGDLEGVMELPLSVGTVGGVTKLHPTAKIALKILGNPTARGLAEIICATGLAQNLSALRALATEGIQKGHMRLHQGNLKMQQSSQRQGATK